MGVLEGILRFNPKPKDQAVKIHPQPRAFPETSTTDLLSLQKALAAESFEESKARQPEYNETDVRSE